jgi:hypothetical protein
MAKTFWGDIFAGVCDVFMPAVAICKGAYDAVSSGNPDKFSEGIDNTMESTTKAAEEFGDKHADTITRGVLGAVAGGLAKDGYNSVFHHKGPPST